MARIFISHSSKDNFEALALRNWLGSVGWTEVFLDLDPEAGISPGEQWERALHEAASRAEVDRGGRRRHPLRSRRADRTSNPGHERTSRSSPTKDRVMDISRAGMREIILAVSRLQTGEKDLARKDLLRLWDDYERQAAPLQLCTIAHFLADIECDPTKELEWDLRALEAATGTRTCCDADALDDSMIGFLPSLHLNVAHCYNRVDEPSKARIHAEIGLRRSEVLPNTGYGNSIRRGLESLVCRLKQRDV